MKIGAGGLQAQVIFELDPVRREGMVRSDQQLRPDFVPEVGRVLADGERLVRFVEELNVAASLVGYPFRFRVRQGKEGVKVFRFSAGEPGSETEISPEELGAIWEELRSSGRLDTTV